ncbi:helix-turn-helix domain-containing protein [Halorussus halophilus]|uniref:helix-turn-helix domain-containing protein n=1 Tax=Halorussus halophilus TaxID=2650975 RepID=UPI0013012C15|nr:helix-turn-helix domain-containing protein [Halorussus halophilus]
MSVIAELSVPVGDFPLGRALSATPDMQVELERVVPTGDNALPFFWVWGDDVETFVSALNDQRGIEEVTVLDQFEDGALVRAVWTEQPSLVVGVLESKATLLEVRSQESIWLLRIRSPDRAGVATLQQYCVDNDIDLRLNWIHTLEAVEAGARYGLTDSQRETIVAAYESGYFDEPRDVTLEDLSEEFDISSRAVSKRLRRGLRNLVESTLFVER